MSSLVPRKIIRYEDFHPSKNSSFDHNDRSRYQHFIAPKKNSTIPGPIDKSSSGQDIDSQLQEHEDFDRQNFLELKNALGLDNLSGWLSRMLDQRILPTLDRIGCGQQIARTLFELTPAAWKFMGPVNDKIIAIHPEINLELEEVLKGLEGQIAKHNGDWFPIEGASPPFKTGTITDRASPEHLFDLLDDIATSWLTLPRAFRFMEKDQCRYLPHYVKTIDSQTNESCLKLFSRITVEFIANYTLKFAGRNHPPDQIEKLLFHGYSAMYWQALRRPPPGMENSAVFDHFLNWISRLTRRSRFLGNEARRSIDQMIKIKSEIFPTININQSQTPSRHGYSRFLVTLRHGTMGVATILKYLGIDQFLETRRFHGRSPFQSRQNEIHGLLYAIQTHYHLESRRTRGYIQEFIGHLKSAYEKSQPAAQRPERKFLYRMINNIQISFNK